MSAPGAPRHMVGLGGMSSVLETYVRGWSEDDRDGNEGAFDRYALLPRVMTGQAGIKATRPLLGMPACPPVFVGAFAGDSLFHDEGLRPIARACRRHAVPLLISEETVTPLERIVAEHDLCWLQIRGGGDVGRAETLIDRATDAGARGIVVTLLAPTHPCPAQQPGGFHLGEELAALGWSTIGSSGAGIGDVAPFPQWSWSELEATVGHARARGLPVIAKGVLHPEDAVCARDVGCAAAMVSNIGRRQLRTAVAPLDMLLEASLAAPGFPLLLDGGVRRGSDVVTACCLGASAAVVVRPMVHVLARGGEAAVADLLDGLITAATATASWVGVASMDELGPEFVRYSDGAPLRSPRTGNIS